MLEDVKAHVAASVGVHSRVHTTLYQAPVSLFFLALQFGEIATARSILAGDANPDEKLSLDGLHGRGMTLLHYMCCSSANTEAIKLLIEHGAGVSIRDQWGWTPLHTVALKGHRGLAVRG